MPYALLIALTVIQDSFEGPLRYWMYFAKMLVGAWCIFTVRDLVPEMRWAICWEAVLAGVLVFAIWVGLDPYYPKLELLFKAGEPWNPFKQFGADSSQGWFFVVVRTIGSALVVPPLEEVFYRSFLYRYFVRLEFTAMPFKQLHWLSLVVTSLLFGLAHYQWLAGFFCGLIYQALVIRKNRLGDAMTAHAITNFLLGCWIVWKGAWQFW
ncbi:MAG TPA: CAAX prenyl protease-related protein [Candidatus Limnocylindrales bacterium]|nr:CAAX prenyl protease-related protein [Candidatus Limnocylindrales bacterium]